MLNLIHFEREGRVVNCGLLKSCVKLFEDMDICDSNRLNVHDLGFENKLLDSTQAYYARKSLMWIKSNVGIAAYYAKV